MLSLPTGRLRVESGSERGQLAWLRKERLTIGRAQGNGSRSSATPRSARPDCELRPGAEGPVLRDLGSTNGILLAGHRVERLTLHHGSTVTVGETRLRFELLDQQLEMELSAADEFGELYGRSLVMRQVFARLERVAPLDLTLLITGATGTGKELVARLVHEMSLRGGRPFLVLDCGSIARELVESTLFGHEKGAFTGAAATRKGSSRRPPVARCCSTRLASMPLGGCSAALLRVISRPADIRVGSPRRDAPVDVRMIAATNRDLVRVDATGVRSARTCSSGSRGPGGAAAAAGSAPRRLRGWPYGFMRGGSRGNGCRPDPVEPRGLAGAPAAPLARQRAGAAQRRAACGVVLSQRRD